MFNSFTAKLFSTVPLAILLACLIIFMFLQECQNERIREDRRDATQILQQKNYQVEKFKKEGLNHARVKIPVIEARNIQLIDIQGLTDKKMEIGNLRRNLISYTEVAPFTNQSLKIPLVDSIKKDTIAYKVFSYKDEFLDFYGVIEGDTLKPNYTIKNPFQIYSYYKRDGKGFFKFLKRKVAVSEIKFLNPNTATDSLYTIIVDRQKSTFRKIVGY